MSLADILLLNLAVIGGIMLALWLVSLPLKNASLVDIFWGIGFIIISWLTFSTVNPGWHRGLLVTVLTTLWGLRLALYLSWRNLGQGEDYRYRAMRERHGSRFGLISLFLVFWLQGLIMWCVSLPLQVAPFAGATIAWLDVLAVGLWLIGWLCESIADWQLAVFKADPASRGRVMDRGLWRYTRHPNYFGDFLVWWGFYLLAASAGYWWTIASPLLMSFLLMRVSGVTLLERSLSERPGYAEYAARTNAFLPGPPRSIE